MTFGRFLFALSLSALALASCAEGPEDAVDEPGATTLPDPAGVEAGDPWVFLLLQSEAIGQDRFVTSTGCAMCHSNHRDATAMRDEADREIAPFNLWQGTMMANAARDPLWRAVVSAEIARTPAATEAIEAKCMRCHAPMASEAARAAGREPMLTDLAIPDGTYQQLAMDGVSCSVCHQIQPANLGTEESYSGGFVIGDERLIFGPHLNPAPGPMQNHVDYTPTYAAHVTQSTLCATCHTLDTHALDVDGVDTGAVFSEQATYREWENSMYALEGEDARTCQACHMPTTSVDGEILETRIARAPPGFDFNIPERQPFGRHAFAGANTLVPAILKAERDVLQPQATDAAFDATLENARHRLEALTADLSVSAVTKSGGQLAFNVTVRSAAGHKMPTGFPSRRAWLQVVVKDRADQVLFSSGAYNDEGRIVDHKGRVLDIEKANAPFEPHRDEIRRTDQVQIYEQVMGDADGAFTSSVIRAAQQIKDNRILPAGYSSSHAQHAKTASVGTDDDEDFAAGEDTVRYVVTTEGAPATIEVSLVYQTLGARYARELFQVSTPEVKGFRTMLERADARPVKVTSVSKEL